MVWEIFFVAAGKKIGHITYFLRDMTYFL